MPKAPAGASQGGPGPALQMRLRGVPTLCPALPRAPTPTMDMDCGRAAAAHRLGWEGTALGRDKATHSAGGQRGFAAPAGWGWGVTAPHAGEPGPHPLTPCGSRSSEALFARPSRIPVRKKGTGSDSDSALKVWKYSHTRPLRRPLSGRSPGGGRAWHPWPTEELGLTFLHPHCDPVSLQGSRGRRRRSARGCRQQSRSSCAATGTRACSPRYRDGGRSPGERGWRLRLGLAQS